MSTGLLDLTDEFVGQFRELRTKYDELRSGTDVGPAPSPSPVQAEQINHLTRELARLQSALQESLEKEACARQQAEQAALSSLQEIEKFQSQAQRQIDTLTAEPNKLKHEILELRGKIDQLKFRIQQLEQSPGSRDGMRFKDLFPKEYEELKKLNELVYLYRERCGDI